MKKLIPFVIMIICMNLYIGCQDRLIVLWDEKPRPLKLQAIVRDFSVNHPDFENYNSNSVSLNLVKPDLGPDNKPVFNSTIGSNQTVQMLTDEAHFNQWYNTIPGINYEYAIDIECDGDTFGEFQYVNNSYFPLKPG